MVKAGTLVTKVVKAGTWVAVAGIVKETDLDVKEAVVVGAGTLVIVVVVDRREVAVVGAYTAEEGVKVVVGVA